MQLTTEETIKLTGIRNLAGYLPGMAVPAIQVELAWRPVAPRVLQRFHAALAPALGGEPWPLPRHPLEPTLAHATEAALALLARAGVPRLLPARLLASRDLSPLRHAVLAFPCVMDAQAAGAALAWACAALAAMENGDVSRQLAGIPALENGIAQTAPTGINSKQFLRAAHAQEVPWRPVWAKVVQFGWGRRQRFLNSSFTDETSNIGSGLARNKYAAGQVLRAAGIPVPPHEVARDAEGAVAIAARLGYPVVVKPADCDGGVGVAAGLQRPEQVAAAFAEASKHSRLVLVEKHVDGNDHRLQVFRGEVFWATHRVPGGVTGDGRQSVSTLLEQLNADPRRGARGSNALLKRIELDDEAQELLQEQALTPASVPAAGQFVRLRRAANVATGGIPVPVLERAHPDNLALAVRAADVLRLDLAGIDLLVPDISRSWLETGGAICEVNAQPQLSPHLPALLLPRLVPAQGRIPVVLVVGAQQSLLRDIGRALSALGCTGVAGAGGVWVEDSMIAPGPLDPCAAGIALLADRRLDIAVLGVDARALQTGLPVDRFDVLVLAEGPEAGAPARLPAWFAAGCTGTVLAASEHPGWKALGNRLGGRPLFRRPVADLPQAVATLLTDRNAC